MSPGSRTRNLKFLDSFQDSLKGTAAALLGVEIDAVSVRLGRDNEHVQRPLMRRGLPLLLLGALLVGLGQTATR